MFHFLRNRLRPVAQRAFQVVTRAFSRWCKPLPASPLLRTIADLARSKPQLVVLNRAGKRLRQK